MTDLSSESGTGPADLIVAHAAELLTMAGSPGPQRGAAQADLALIPDGAVAIAGDTILAVGPSATILAAYQGAETQVLDAAGAVVTPGLVDAHTHLVFAGSREHEYE